MNWLSNIFRKYSKTGSLISASMLGRAVFPKRNFTTYAKEAYQLNIVAYRCIELISTAAASVPWNLYNEATDEEVDDKKHPILTLLRRPNPSQSGKEFFTAAYAYDLLTGNSYIERVTVNGGKTIQELWAQRPDRMKIIPGRFGMPARYEYTIGGVEPTIFEVDSITGKSDILHVKRFNPLDDWYGQSPLEAIGMSVDSHNEATKWNFALLQNGARPSGAMQAESTLDEVEFLRLKKELEEGYSKGRQGKPMLLEGGLTWVQMMLSQMDMDWLAGKERAASEIAIGYKVPEQLVGVKGQQTYNNYREARMALYEDAVLPLLDRYAECLTYWLQSFPGFESYCLRYDEDRIPALYPRREIMWEKVNAAKFISIDEKREALGYEPYDPTNKDPGNIIFISASDLPLSDAGISSMTSDGTPDPNADPNADPANPALEGSPLGAPPTGGPVQDLALNGTQIQAVLQIVSDVVDKLLPAESALQLLLVAFPSIDEATAHLLIDPAESFEKPEPDPALLPMIPGAPAGPGIPKPVKPKKPTTPVEKRVMWALMQLKATRNMQLHARAHELAYGVSGKSQGVLVNVKSGDMHVHTAPINVDAGTTIERGAISTPVNIEQGDIAIAHNVEEGDSVTTYERDPDTNEIKRSQKVFNKETK